MDFIGQILWYIMFVTPFITIPIVWKFSSQKKIIKTLIGLILALVLSCVLYHVSIEIAFRNGMGPN